MFHLAINAKLFRCRLVSSGRELQVHLAGLPQVWLAEADLETRPLCAIALQGGTVGVGNEPSS